MLCEEDAAVSGAWPRSAGRCGLWGLAAIGLGLIILLALILPSEFWWFFLAAGLIGLGIWCLRCCW